MGLSPEITVEVDPKLFTFSYESQVMRLEPLITVATEDWKVIAIGERRSEPGVLTIALFEMNQSLPRDVEKMDLLTAFMRFAIGKLFEKKKLPVLRPKVIFHGVQCLEHILCGYHRILLETATLASGARAVRFD